MTRVCVIKFEGLNEEQKKKICDIVEQIKDDSKKRLREKLAKAVEKVRFIPFLRVQMDLETMSELANLYVDMLIRVEPDGVYVYDVVKRTGLPSVLVAAVKKLNKYEINTIAEQLREEIFEKAFNK